MQINYEDNLEVIREEQNSPLASIMDHEEVERKENETELFAPTVKCICANTRYDGEEKELDAMKLRQILEEKEKQLREEFEKKYEQETSFLKERFNFILQ